MALLGQESFPVDPRIQLHRSAKEISLEMLNRGVTQNRKFMALGEKPTS
jgi:hypothetical protein